jgi:uncharacterized membrane protein YdcZ (DUF606 family)
VIRKNIVTGTLPRLANTAKATFAVCPSMLKAILVDIFGLMTNMINIC